MNIIIDILRCGVFLLQIKTKICVTACTCYVRSDLSILILSEWDSSFWAKSHTLTLTPPPLKKKSHYFLSLLEFGPDLRNRPGGVGGGGGGTAAKPVTCTRPTCAHVHIHMIVHSLAWGHPTAPYQFQYACGLETQVVRNLKSAKIHF